MKRLSLTSILHRSVGLLSLLLALCAETGRTENTAAGNALRGIQGPSTVPLQGIADLALPAGFTFLGETDAQAILRQLGAGVTGKEIGLISPASQNWFVVVLFLDFGYFEASAKSIDLPAQMLADLQSAEQIANDDRQRRNRPTVTLQGWDVVPNLDATAGRLEWAIKAETGGKSLINHYITRLGRSGVVKFCLVDQHHLASTAASFRELANNLTFKNGERYSDYAKGDRLAAGGLQFLITGRDRPTLAGPGVEKQWVEAKTGKVLMRVFWFGFFAIVALTLGYVSGLVAARRQHRRPRFQRSAPSAASAERPRWFGASSTRSKASSSSSRKSSALVEAGASRSTSPSTRRANGDVTHAQPTRQFDPWMYYQRLTRDLYNHG